MSRTLRTINVLELKDLCDEIIAAYGEEALVVFTTNYGDYHRTQQALGVRGEYEEVKIEESGYSNSGFAIVEDDEEDDGECPDCGLQIGINEDACTTCSEYMSKRDEQPASVSYVVIR